MIARIWYGWTTPENADAYEALLRTEVFPWIVGKKIGGFRRIELLRGPAGGEIEFATIMWFELDGGDQGFCRRGLRNRGGAARRACAA